MALGDGIRRNIAHVDPTERVLLRDAMVQLNQRFFSGSRTDSPAAGGVSWWFKQDEIHRATHVHRGPGFIPWHREIVNRLEALLRQINPQLSLHYWDWTQDPRNIPDANLGGGTTGNLDLFTTAFMGYGGTASASLGEPWLSAGYYVPGTPNDREVTDNPADPCADVFRDINGSPLAADRISKADGTGILDQADFADMRVKMENAHDDMHGFVNMGGAHISFRDPFVFFLHSNLDRIYARWQTDPAHPTRLAPGTVYGTESGDAELNSFIEPWSTGVSEAFGTTHYTRPWCAPEHQGEPHDYKHASVVVPPCYDTNFNISVRAEVVNPGAPPVINFNDIPSGDTAARAASLRVYGCGAATINVKPGFGPAAPFSVLFPASGQVVLPHENALFVEARIWFAYTAGVADVAVPDGSVTLQCIASGQEFIFTLKANSIVRPRVAVMLALDQSGSMNDLAGTSGDLRINVLKSATTAFVDVIKANNGVGLIRFDTDAYPVEDATYPGLAMTRILSNEAFDPGRLLARNSVSLHATNINGWTSIGDGLQLARTLVAAVPAADYEHKAIILFTDGIETADVSIASVASSIDNRTFAIGLGNELQVNTASLHTLTQGTGGYLKLTGTLSADINDYFLTTKYFLQILSGVTNDQIVLDPDGYIAPGTTVTIPFTLNETDIDATVVLLTDYPVVNMIIETPGGEIIQPSNVAGLGISYSAINATRNYRFTLPVAFAGGNHIGEWKAILKVDANDYKKYAASLDRLAKQRQSFLTHGARYSVLVNTYSNLKMRATLTQNSFEPGATLTLRSILTEYDIPVDHRATVFADVMRPDRTHFKQSLNEAEPGVFDASFPALLPGIYHCRIAAGGATLRGKAFTREITLDGAVYRGGDAPSTPTRPDDQLPTTGETGGFANVPTGIDKVVEIITHCCRFNSRLLWGVLILLVIIVVLILRR
ncbi:MAG: tyrosinase family protein [Fibrobacteria bacterium]